MLRSLTLALASSALVLVVLPSCSDGGSTAGGTCASYYSALVSYYDRCEGGSGTTALANARPRFETLCANALAAPGAANLSGSVSTCTSSVSTATCGDDVDCVDGTGTLADGAACGGDYQCTGFCNKADEAVCGTCAPRIAIDGACKNLSSNECVEGARCVSDGASDGKCRPVVKRKAGESCATGIGDPVECDKGLQCFFSSAGATSTCRAPAPEGGDCGSRSDCTSGLVCLNKKCAQPVALGGACEAFNRDCAKGLACGADKKCQTQTFVKAGVECDEIRQCERGRCKGQSVEVSGTGETKVTPGTCEDPLPDGAACTRERAGGGEPPRACDVFAECINGVCTLSNPASCK